MEAGSEAADMQPDFQEALRELCFWEVAKFDAFMKVAYFIIKMLKLQGRTKQKPEELNKYRKITLMGLQILKE